MVSKMIQTFVFYNSVELIISSIYQPLNRSLNSLFMLSHHFRHNLHLTLTLDTFKFWLGLPGTWESRQFTPFQILQNIFSVLSSGYIVTLCVLSVSKSATVLKGCFQNWTLGNKDWDLIKCVNSLEGLWDPCLLPYLSLSWAGGESALLCDHKLSHTSELPYHPARSKKSASHRLEPLKP